METSCARNLEEDSEDVLEISDIPESFNEDLLLMLIENNSDGYDCIAIRDFDSSRKRATVSIKSPQIAERILNNGLNWNNKTMGIKRVSAFEHEQSNEHSLPIMRTVQLTGDCESLSKGSLLMYLESERYGGGKVNEFHVNSSGFLVTFEDANVARAFSSRDHEFCKVKFKASLLESWPKTNGSCAIEVIVTGESDVNTIYMLLESRHYGGSHDIIEDHFEDDYDPNRFVFTLKNHENVQSIFKKTDGKIKFDRVELTLKILSPAKPPTFVEDPDKKKLIFLELNAQSLADKKELQTFVKNCSKSDVQQLFFCCENDCILVQYRDEPNFENIMNVLCCKPFKGSMISVQRIAKTKQIKVYGWKKHEDLVAIYFEKYSNGTVEHFFEDKEGVLTITFQDFDSVDEILKQVNEISQADDISIAPYIEAFEGRSFKYLEPPPLIPDDVKIPIRREIYGFLYENQRYKDQIETELSKLNCSIQWPTSISNVEATLTWDNKRSRCQNMRSWSSDVIKCFEDKIEELDYCEFSAHNDAFDFVASESKKFKPGKTKLLKKIDEENKKIFATGLKDVVQKFRSLLDEQEEIARNIKRKSVKFNRHQFLLITKSGRIENLKKNFKITVYEDENDHSLLLKGPAEHVKRCQLKLEEFRNKMKEEEVPLFGKHLEFFQREDVVNKIAKEFELKKIISVLSVDSDSLLLHSFDDLAKAQDCLASLFTISEFEIDKSEMEAMNYVEWSNFEKNLKCKFQEPFMWSSVNGKMYVLAATKEHDKIEKEFHKYFKEHAKVAETFMKPQPVVDFLITTNEFQEIKIRASLDDVQLHVAHGSALQLSGKRAKVAEVKVDLEKICSRIISKTHLLEYKANHLFEAKDSNIFVGICSKCKVHISLRNPRQNHERYATSPTKNGDCKISVICGSIADQKTDIIFNCCPSNLELSHSAISKALLEVSGSQLQDDLKAKCGTKKLLPGEIVETPGYKLNCNSVYHGYIIPWNKNSSESEKTIKHLIRNSLEKADLDRKTSISFPAFGTGKLGVPQDKAAKIMVREANNFISRSSSLKDIRFVVYEGDKLLIQAFQSECKQPTSGNKASDGMDGNTLLNSSGVCLKAVNRDLLEEKCDAIVNSSSHDMAVEGASASALTKAIMEKAGDQVKKECINMKTLKDGLALTSSGNLPNCEYIFHLSGKDASSWEKVISNMLKEANKKNMKSIAMPLVGTGHHRISIEDIAQVIFQCLKNFTTTKSTSLQELKVMIPKAANLTKFKEAICSLNSPKGNKCIPNGGKVEIEIYGFNHESLEKAFDEIQKELNKLVTEKEISHSLSNISHSFFVQIEKKHEVQITCSNNAIKVVGKKDISAAILEINDLVKEQMKKEFKSMELETFVKYVTWSYCGKDGKVIKYGNHSTYLLENAFQRQDSSVKFSDKNNIKHDVVFKGMKDTINGKFIADVSRVLKGEISLPTSWSVMSQKDVVDLVVINKNTTEYDAVQNLFHAGMLKPNIIKVERIQNVSLYRQYQCKKQDMERKNKGIEVRVWHGTSEANVPNINVNNFNRAFGNQGTIGVGVYFAINPDYSIRSYCPPGVNGTKCIYLAKVLVGRVGQGNRGIKEPPELGNASKERYDSVADNPASPTMYVIFYDCQMYPEYLITFQ